MSNKKKKDYWKEKKRKLNEREEFYYETVEDLLGSIYNLEEEVEDINNRLNLLEEKLGDQPIPVHQDPKYLPRGHDPRMVTGIKEEATIKK
jgi:hypothetical protein